MNDFRERQIRQLHFKVMDYRQGVLGLDSLIKDLEGLARLIDEQFWTEKMFPICLNLESINSEAIDKKRKLTLEQIAKIEASLKEVDSLIGS